jgi:recombinational DNA repair protein RecR
MAAQKVAVRLLSRAKRNKAKNLRKRLKKVEKRQKAGLCEFCGLKECVKVGDICAHNRKALTAAA